MDDTAVKTKPDWPKKHTGERTDYPGEYFGDDEECDGEVWDTLSRSFCLAQTVLDENRALIEEVNNNHESKIPDNMVKNVGLIRQINGNISKVLSIYSDLSINFSNIVRQRRIVASDAVNGEKRDGDGEDKAEDEAELVTEKSEMVELMAVGVHPFLCYPYQSADTSYRH